MPDNNQKIDAARKVYETYWDSYLKGDIETFASALDEQLELIGTSESEIAHSKSEGLVILEAQMHEVVGKAELRNRQIKVVPINKMLLINEQSDIYVLTEATWIFYSKIRISTWLRETEDAWKVVQQHGSLPDVRVGEGETLAIDKITKENLELRDAVKRRTAELEHKNHELGVEASLERVRTIAMGMKKPDDLLDVCRTISEQLEQLNIGNIRNVQVAIIDEPKKIYANYQFFNAYAKSVFEETGYENNSASMAMVTEMQKSANSFFIGSIKGDELQKFRDWRKEYNQLPDPILDNLTEVFYYFYSIGQGGLGLTTYKAINENELEIFKRFHLVFKLAYRRFMDIQKAEEQAREAKIEVALEKVRSRTMGMQKSDELANVANVLFQEMNDLVHNLWTCGFVLCENDRTEDEWWLSLEDGFTRGFFLPNVNDYAHAHLYEGWLKSDDFRTVQLEDDQLQAHYNWLMEIPVAKSIFDDMEAAGMQRPEWQKLHAAYFSKGYLVIITREPCSEEAIFKRFAQVFDLTYTRFLDLQKAEAQARESQLELSLERIRAQVTGMQESTDLLDIVVTMRSEFVNLGHEAHYFWHMRWLPNIYQKAMTSGDGTKIGMVMTLPRHIHGDIAAVAAWEKSKDPTHVLAMDVDVAVDYVDKMITMGDFERVDPQAPTLDDIRHIGGITFVMARTTHGEIGYSLPGMVPNPPKEAMDTLVRFAGVFDLAYKRFEDLKTAEKDLIEIKQARQKAEEALTELKATQTQLIQQEKLASLGQLTAGIAHEIKNPLNFVNNFSEVSSELIDEVFEELEKLNDSDAREEIIAILNDVKGNLTKVHEHGTRADSIVKSMLQHSRGGSGKLEPTDLNALIKEYVNLSFHGMRAGKNPINVAIDLQLDEEMKTVPLVEEDFSRVLLNLCNNAFDAMRSLGTECSARGESYSPKLTVSTKSENNRILIEIQDNGPGIPDEIKDKILQPFFTTKKGTEGTGLGLSITNDIIKAHGGELKVESIKGTGTAFRIQLPLSIV